MLRSYNRFSKQIVNKSEKAVNSIGIELARYPVFIYTLFYFFSAYLVLPLVDLPFLGLSISSPIMFLIAVPCIFKPPKPWLKRYQLWVFLAIFLWIGIFFSTAANGLLSFGVLIDSDSIILLIQYIYWLIVFVITTYFASQGTVIDKTVKVLGWSAMLLGIIRLVEVILYGNISVSMGTQFLTQNAYGALFSMFSPFLLLLMIGKRKWQTLIALVGYFLLLAAVAINGSRGSWISIAAGLGIGLLILIISKPRKFITLIIPILVLLIGFTIIWFNVPEVSNAVSERFNTLQTLGEDKSYLFRQIMIQKGLKIFEENPIIGIGSGRFTKTYVDLDLPRVFREGGNLSRFTTQSAHNSYIVILAENGLLAAIPFAIFLIILLFRGFSAALRSIRRDEYLPLAVFLSFIQMSIHFWVIASLTNTSTWFVYGLIAAVIVMERNRVKECA